MPCTHDVNFLMTKVVEDEEEELELKPDPEISNPPNERKRAGAHHKSEKLEKINE